MGHVEEKKKMKSDTLFHSAFELFTSQGFNQTTISDIVKRAGVAKGTFYLYFKDKYDIKDKLISYKTSTLFQNALDSYQRAIKGKVMGFNDTMIFLINDVVDRLKQNKPLLRLISKDLSWGVFKNAFYYQSDTIDSDFYDAYQLIMKEDGLRCDNEELMLFSIVELVGSTCYSSILMGEPEPIDKFKPYLFKNINAIIDSNCRKISE